MTQTTKRPAFEPIDPTLTPMRLVFVDTETTGLARPGTEPTGRVTEFCAVPVDIVMGDDRISRMIVRREDKVHFRLELTPADLAEADPISLQVNGYLQDQRIFSASTHRDDSETKRLWELASSVMSDRIVCSQNVLFDLQFIEKELKIYGLIHTKSWRRKHVELWTLSLLAQISNQPNQGVSEAEKVAMLAWKKNDITSLSCAAELVTDHADNKAHTADGDVEFGIALFAKFFNLATSNMR